MKNYVVALIDFFDNKIKQYKVEAENEYEAFKIAYLQFMDNDKNTKEWLESDKFPETMIGIMGNIGDWEMDCSIIEVKEF